MPRFITPKLAAACATALILSLALAATAAAKGFNAELRVVGTGGKIVTEKIVTTAAGSVSVKTSPKATCFGAGNEGSGASARIKGNTALGLLAQASKSTSALRPLTLTDAFDFGLGLCGVGRYTAKGKASWYLKINHKSPSVGGDAATIRPGDVVLWDLAPSYPYPDELEIIGPGEAENNVPFTVRVWSYDEKGKKKPASGVTVSGASGPTDQQGKATVTLSKPANLVAKKGTAIPARTPVCVGGKCPAGA